MKSMPVRIPVMITPKFPTRFDSPQREVSTEQAGALHPLLNAMIEGKSRQEQHEAACNLTRGSVVHVWVTVDDAGVIELAMKRHDEVLP